MLQIVIDKQAAVSAFVWQEELWQYGRQAPGAVAALGMKILEDNIFIAG